MPLLCSSLIVVFVVACGGKKEKSETEAQPSAAAEPPPVDAAPPPPKLDASRISLTMCNLGEFAPTEFVRGLHVDLDGHVYIMNDSRKPHELVPTADGCGLKPGRILDADTFALSPMGALVAAESQWTDDGNGSTRPECDSVEVSLDWRGAYVNGRAYTISARYGRDSRLQIEDPASKPCVPAFPPVIPEGRLASIAANSDQVLVLEFHGSGHDNVVWRYGLDGTLRDKVGLGPDGKSFIGWAGEVATCAEGVCVSDGSTDLVFIGADGAKVASHKLSALSPDMGVTDIKDLVESPGRGLYVLVEMTDPSGAKKIDLARVDGVYAGQSQ